MKKNQKGFGIVESLLVIFIIGAIAGLGYYIYWVNSGTGKIQTKKATPPSSPATNQASTKQTVTFNSASYNFSLPKEWKFEEIQTDDASEKLVYVTDPTNKLRLEIQTLAKSSLVNDSSKSNYIANFVGIKSKEYYLHGYIGNSKVSDSYELLLVSSCTDKLCTTDVNNDFTLNLSIRSTDGTIPTKVDNPLVKDIEAIIRTVQF
jgi:hypothetical protein